MFHEFEDDISGIPLPVQFTYPFCYEPHPLTRLAARQVQRYLAQRADWHEEIGQGKMFGVLVVQEDSGKTGFLAAFSGNIAHSNRHPYFVPPVYDLLRPDGFFRIEEARITAINRRIADMEQSGRYLSLQARLDALRSEAEAAIREFSTRIKVRKQERDERRKQTLSDEENNALIRESQFEKAELRRLKKAYEGEVSRSDSEVQAWLHEIGLLKTERKKRSAALQRKLFEQFRMLDATGQDKGLCAIFEEARHELPPAGAGECAAPKLLQFAFLHHLRPVAMGEFWWGASPKAEIRKHLHFYPACIGKCEPILKYMLNGLEVEANPLEASPPCRVATVYEDAWIWVVDKPAGMLSVPGKGNRPSVYGAAKERFPDATGPLVVHRLDMHTSGLLVVAKTKEAHGQLQKQFLDKTIEKEYIAILEGNVERDEGEINLPLLLDYEHRPQQKVDYEHGKPATTKYKVLARNSDGTTRVAFYPQTGRTHQLRVHAAHPLGLNAPIKGDMLYGTPSVRLYLHAASIRFRHPADGRMLSLHAPVPF